jgi:tetratricopeptide (TPR) repeat protein
MARSALFCATLSFALVGSLVGCGPKAGDGTGAGSGSGPGDGSGADQQDDVIDFPPLGLNGTYFSPDGLDRPGMLLAHGKKKTTIEKQRAAVKKAKPETRGGEATILATMLYEAALKEKDDSKRLGLLEDARKVLSDTAAAIPDQVDALLLHNLACLSFDLGDLPGAIAALDAAVKKAPDDANAPERKAYLAYYLIRGGRNDEAAALVQGMEPSKEHPEQAYAIAWAKWRSGDLPGARAGMLAAVQGWQSTAYLPAIKRDTLIFAARAGATVDEAVALAQAYAALTKDDPKYSGDQALLETLVYMHQAFSFTGRTADSIALVDRIFSGVKSVSKSDVPKLHLEQADAARILGRTKDLTGHVDKAVETLAACGAECKGKTSEDVGKLTFNLARLAALFYNTSQDERWFDAAESLYASYQKVPGVTDGAAVAAEAASLKAGHDHAKKNAGIHDKTAIQYVIEPHASEVLGCYDAELQRDSKLGGTLKLQLEVAASGEVTGASSDPAGGQEGLAAVAACAVEHARAWVFPARTKPGVTRISASYTLQPQATR